MRFVLISVSLLQAARLSRAYDRWWNARLGFSAVGAAALSLTQRLAAWVGESNPALVADVARWGTAWQCAVQQVCTGVPAYTVAPEMLRPDEARIYLGSRKGRQLAVLRLTQLIASSGVDRIQLQILDDLLKAGVAGSGMCTAVKLQCMPYAISLLGMGFTQLFLILTPLTVISSSTETVQGDFSTGDALFTTALALLLQFAINVLLLGADEVRAERCEPLCGDWYSWCNARLLAACAAVRIVPPNIYHGAHGRVACRLSTSWRTLSDGSR